MKRKIFNIFSLIFLGLLFILYTTRFIYYYKIEHKVYPNDTKLVDVLLADEILGEQGIKKVDDYYVYGSNTKNNYLYYKGRMWRIFSVSLNIRLISDEVETLLPYDDLNTYLEENNYKLLTDDLYELLNENNYLKTNVPFWLECLDNCYVDTTGKVESDSNAMLGVRPLIEIDRDIKYIKGNGSIDDPYIIDTTRPANLKDTYVGEYVTFSNNLWRIIDKGESVKIALEGTQDDLDDFYDSLEDKEYIKEGIYYTGTFKKSYKDTLNKENTLNIGTLVVGDSFINTYPNIYTLTGYAYNSSSYYVVNDSNRMYVDKKSSYKVRPTIYLDGDLFIVSGSGVKTDPYKVGR